jgi:Holliday junction resolvase-like predicted endonuclease
MDVLMKTPIGLPARVLGACGACGWWAYWLQTGRGLLDLESGERPGWSLYGAIAELRRLDVADIGAPIDEVKRYLTARYESRFDCHPRLFEKTVASVFESLGYRAEATAYTRDGGVDIILRHDNGTTTGVQVKRSRNPIAVEQIRSLAGALLQGGHTAGMFVTTSRFSSAATKARRIFAERGCPIEFLDARRFFEALRISQRPQYRGYEDWFTINGEPELHTIYEEEDEAW